VTYKLENPFHVGRHALPVPVVFTRERETSFQVPLEDLVEGVFSGWGMAAAVRSKSTPL
jgi:hypothetical protein